MSQDPGLAARFDKKSLVKKAADVVDNTRRSWTAGRSMLFSDARVVSREHARVYVRTSRCNFLVSASMPGPFVYRTSSTRRHIMYSMKYVTVCIHVVTICIVLYLVQSLK